MYDSLTLAFRQAANDAERYILAANYGEFRVIFSVLGVSSLMHSTQECISFGRRSLRLERSQLVASLLVGLSL